MTWREFLATDYLVMHLRDGCPLLPYTGRATGEWVALDDGDSALELRMPTSAVTGHPWQILCMNADVRTAVDETTGEATQRLGSYLGRSATVADLRLLGDNIPVTPSGCANVSGGSAFAGLYRCA